MHFLVPVRVLWRGARLVVHLSLGIGLTIFITLIHGRQWHLQPAGMRLYQWWMRRAAGIIGIRIIQHGQPLQQNVLLAANHISFLDILVIAATTPARFLSKDTVRYWPVIGFLTSGAGTVFIKRGRQAVIHETKHALSRALKQNRPLALFPEGTTTIGEHVNRFHTGLFQAAVDSRTAVQPVALRYIRNGKIDRIAAYIDRDNFLLTLIKLLAQTETVVHLTYCPMINSHTQTRHELAKASHTLISQTLATQAA